MRGNVRHTSQGMLLTTDLRGHTAELTRLLKDGGRPVVRTKLQLHLCYIKVSSRTSSVKSTDS